VPAAIAIPAAISGATSIVGGLLGSSAAKKAAGVQQQASAQAQAKLLEQLGIVNPQILQAAKDAATGVTGATTAAGQNLTDVTNAQAGRLGDAATGANAFLSPFIQGGTAAFQNLSQLMAPGGDLTKQFSAADMQTLDPGYQFRIDQANKALASSAAAKGGALGGGALRALDTLSQNNASGEMQNAFNRFTTQQQNRFNMLNSLSQTGLTAGTTAGGNLMTSAQQIAALLSGAAQQTGTWNIGGAEYGGNALQNATNLTASNTLGTYKNIADLMTQGANAQASGIVGSANAWTGALGGIGNAAINAGNMYQQQQTVDNLGMWMNPAVTPYLRGYGPPAR
jgi:hypothetical protein